MRGIFLKKWIIRPEEKVHKRGINFYLDDICPDSGFYLPWSIVYKNDGFNGEEECKNRFRDYPNGEMAILHLMRFLYG
jgi:hypothetical protein